jgi:hypothetical protein
MLTGGLYAFDWSKWLMPGTVGPVRFGSTISCDCDHHDERFYITPDCRAWILLTHHSSLGLGTFFVAGHIAIVSMSWMMHVG